MEATSRFELEIKVLQTYALPLGYVATKFVLERETGFEPATSTLARLHSTTELLPRGVKGFIGDSAGTVNRKKGKNMIFSVIPRESRRFQARNERTGPPESVRVRSGCRYES